jgi:carbon monoxide dehydrogenase subunit G
VHFDEELRVPVSVPEAWDFLWQTERVAACLPGCTGVQEVEAGKTYRAQFEDRIGPYKVRFEMDVIVEDAKPQEWIRVRATGRDKALGASQTAVMQVALREVGPRDTLLDVDADVEVLGKVAALGQFAIKRKAKDIVNQFARNLQAELQPRTPGGAHA